MATNGKNVSDAPLGAGDSVGKYEIKDVLGTGGQAIVYKAYDPMLDRFVAIKQIAPNLAADKQYMESLQANVRTLARLGQRNEAIVTIHEVIQDERGLFYVMEFVEGHTLETIIRETDGPTEPKAALLVLFRLAAALHEVHAAGIIHRDIKPSNIILTEGLRPKIIDFGVAASTDAQRSMPLATTKYLAPEIYEGGKVDGRADIYSLGFLAYELLLGRPKFNEVFEEVVRDKHSESLRWMKWHGNAAVKAPALHELNPTIPLGLSRIVERMTAKNIEDRFTSTEELGVAIKRSFKPKGRAGGPMVGAPAGASAGQAKMAQLSQPTGLGTLEDEALEVGPPPGVIPPDAAMMDEGPETAPLPKQPMSRKTKIALGALAAAGLIAIVIVGIHKHRQKVAQQNVLANSSANLYREARAAYKNEQFDQALALHQRIAKEHPRSIQTLQGTVYIPMCQAHLAIAAGQWDQAQVHQADAEAAADKIQEEADDEKDRDLIEWTRRRLDDIKKIGQKAYSYQIFSEAMARARAELQRPPGSVNEFNQISRDIDREIGRGDVNLTPQQASAVVELKNQVERGRFMWEFRRYMAEGDQQLQRRDYDKSEKAYRDAQAMLTSGKDEAVRLLPAVQKKSLETDVNKQLALVRKRRSEDRTHEAVNAALRSGNPSELEKALREVLKQDLTPGQRQKYERMLRNEQVRDFLAKARKQLQDGNIAAAKGHLERALSIDKNNAEAKGMLAQIEQSTKRGALVKAADAAHAKRDFAKAAKLYEQAAAVSADAHVTDNLRDCRYQMKIASAADLAKKGQFDKATEEYNAAKTIQPAMTAQVDSMIALMQTERQYQEYLKQGNEALAKGRWADALKKLAEAKGVKATPEVDQRISETHFQKHLAEGKAAMEDDNIPLARWNFTRCQKYKDSPEVKKLLAELSKKTSEE